MISGFVMVYTSWRGQLTAGRFLSRRLIRIYPIYWVVAATYLGLHIILQTRYSLTVRQVAGAALLLPGELPRIIGPGWTLSFEMYFYLCFAIALCAGLRRGIQLLTAFYVLSVGVGILLRPQSSAGHVLTDTLLLEFMAGAWLGYAFSRGLRVQPRIGGVMVVTSLLLFASGFWLDYERLPSVVAWGVPSLMLVAGALALERQLQSGIGRAVAKLGDSSYLLYLSHVLVIDVLLATPISLINWRELALLMTVALAAACAAIAAVGYEIVELPLLRALKRGSLRPSRRKVRELAAPQ